MVVFIIVIKENEENDYNDDAMIIMNMIKHLINPNTQRNQKFNNNKKYKMVVI